MKYERAPVTSPGSFSERCFDVDSFMKNAEEMQGTFDGTVQWCEDPESGDWRSTCILITERGSLECQADSKTIVSSPQISEPSTEKPRIDHLQGCGIKLIERSGNSFPIIQVTTKSQRDFFSVNDIKSFECLLYSLIWWSGLHSKGIFNKISLRPTPITTSTDGKATNLLVSQLVVYGPLPNRRIPAIKQLSRPSFLPKSKSEEEWFPAMGVLKSDGSLDLLQQNDGSLIYSLDIRSLLRSEIRLLDASLQADNMLFLGIISELREELGLAKRRNLIVGGPTMKDDATLLLKFPLSIDVEDWLVALKSFALAEYLSLKGAHDFNRLRISNRFKLSIVEGAFPSISASTYGSSSRLYVDLSIWGHIWGRTASVEGTETPFWREEFTFDESVKINNLKIEVKQRNENKKDDETLGFVEITQEMINDITLNKETRLPVLDRGNKRLNIGTICIRIVSSLNFILPAANFCRFESALAEVNLSQIVNYVRKFSLGSDVTFEDIAGILLDVFQALDKEDDWFSALIDRELLDLDGSLTRNTLSNRTTTHIYGTLFRGNSILTRSMESFFYRVGKEYLELSIGPVLRSAIRSEGSCEVDPERIKEDDPQKKEALLAENRRRLLKMVKDIWHAIYSTSNDIPMPIKNQMRTLRKKLELICIDDDVTRVLNCVSGMLFLRFFCPIILNPKLFNLVRRHLSEQSRRNVTLVSKVILNLSNLSFFGSKEPYMKEMNCFIDDHRGELLDYIDKVTQKKLDFAPKKLRLTNSVIRPKLVMNKEILAELPTNPYLIDRYLRETELFIALATCAINQQENNVIPHSMSVGQITRSVANIEISLEDGRTEIGELEFEKITENNVDVFSQDLIKFLKPDEQVSGDSDTGTQAGAKADMRDQLERESVLLFYRTEHLKRLFADYEFPAKGIEDRRRYAKFLVDSTYCTKAREIMVNPEHLWDQNEKRGRLFSTPNNTGLLDSIIPRVSPHSSSSGSLPRSESSFAVGRKLSMFKSPKVNNLNSQANDEQQSMSSNRSGIKRWFRRQRQNLSESST